ncbi:putative benzoate 4-monooxygenase cytochrome P450 [Hypoxylon crocopeplum]|nr:putative benzoate 4-monooxygenase cytochrome P450 [Hypoxylon crocopeplum]
MAESPIISATLLNYSLPGGYPRILVLGIGVALVFQAFRTWWPLRHIPGPLFAKITNLQRVWWVKTGRAHLIHEQIHQKYGEVVRIGPNMVSISNPEAIPTVYPMRPGFPKSDFYATLRPYTPDHGTLLAVFNTQDEQVHKRIKNPIAPLYSLSNVVLFEGLIDEVLECLEEQLDNRFSQTGATLNLGDWLQYFAFDVMGTLTFSKRYGFIHEGRDAGGMLATIYNHLKAQSVLTQITWLDPIINKNRIASRLFPTPGMSILGFVGKVIHERLQTPEDKEDIRASNGSKRQFRDYLSHFLEIQQSNDKVPTWAPTAWVFSNVVAGSDSTGTVMKTVMYNLLCHPSTLEKLYKELAAANLSRPYPKWGEVCLLPYLDACIQEGVRLHPPFALPFERVVPAGGITVLGKYLPGGTLVGGNPYVVNRHRQTFGDDPDSWSPERWLVGGEQHKKKLEKSVLTFGAGRRVCLGKHLGLLELKKIIPFLVLTYDMSVVDPEDFSVENGWFFKQTGFHAKLKKRPLPEVLLDSGVVQSQS